MIEHQCISVHGWSFFCSRANVLIFLFTGSVCNSKTEKISLRGWKVTANSWVAACWKYIIRHHPVGWPPLPEHCCHGLHWGLKLSDHLGLTGWNPAATWSSRKNHCTIFLVFRLPIDSFRKIFGEGMANSTYDNICNVVRPCNVTPGQAEYIWVSLHHGYISCSERSISDLRPRASNWLP